MLVADHRCTGVRATGWQVEGLALGASQLQEAGSRMQCWDLPSAKGTCTGYTQVSCITGHLVVLVKVFLRLLLWRGCWRLVLQDVLQPYRAAKGHSLACNMYAQPAAVHAPLPTECNAGGDRQHIKQGHAAEPASCATGHNNCRGVAAITDTLHIVKT
jgi:hypothetical protein